MADEIQIAHTATGATLYAFVWNGVGQIYDGVTDLTFEAYATANINDFDIALTEKGTASQFYSGTFPSVAAGTYHVTIYSQAGGSPAEGDTLVGAGTLYWDGSEIAKPDDFGGGATAATIADAVWDEAQGDHVAAGSFGESCGTEIAAILADTGTDGVVLAANAITAGKIAADAIGSSELATTAVNEIADAILKRDIDNVEASAAVHSLCSAILKLVAKFDVSTGITTRTDGSTTHMTQVVTTDSGLTPVKSLDAAT